MQIPRPSGEELVSEVIHFCLERVVRWRRDPDIENDLFKIFPPVQVAQNHVHFSNHQFKHIDFCIKQFEDVGFNGARRGEIKDIDVESDDEALKLLEQQVQSELAALEIP